MKKMSVLFGLMSLAFMFTVQAPAAHAKFKCDAFGNCGDKFERKLDRAIEGVGAPVIVAPVAPPVIIETLPKVKCEVDVGRWGGLHENCGTKQERRFEREIHGRDKLGLNDSRINDSASKSLSDSSASVQTAEASSASQAL